MKSPAFQFYPTDYLASQRVQMMTLEEEGAYCRLLWSCWQHGSIPSDPELAAKLIGKGCSATLARVVLPMFEVACGEGRLTHDRLERERAKQIAWREKSAKGGRKTAEMRSASNGGSTTPPSTAQPQHQPKAHIPSPSSVSNISTEHKKFTPPSLDEVKLYADKAGIIENDALWFWQKMEAQDWFNGRKKCKSWGMTLCSWKTAGYLPSQKNGMAFGSSGQIQQPKLHGNWKDSL